MHSSADHGANAESIFSLAAVVKGANTADHCRSASEETQLKTRIPGLSEKPCQEDCLLSRVIFRVRQDTRVSYIRSWCGAASEQISAFLRNHVKRKVRFCSSEKITCDNVSRFHSSWSSAASRSSAVSKSAIPASVVRCGGSGTLSFSMNAVGCVAAYTCCRARIATCV